MSETEDYLTFENLNLNDTKATNVKLIGSPGSCVAEPKMALQMETEALKTITLVGYQGPLVAETEFKKALEEGPKNVEYTKLVSFLTNELRIHCGLDECVNAIATAEDSASFIMEVSSFLNELGCQHDSLTRGHVSDRLSTVSDRLLLVQLLAEELIAARIIRENRPEKKIELKLQESSQAADLRKVLQVLGFPKPPANITMASLMQKVVPTVKGILAKADAELIGNPIFNGTLSEKQWETIANFQQQQQEHYRTRRAMALKRLDCTIQSFQWSNKTKGAEDKFNTVYGEKRKQLSVEPDVDLSDLIAARDDLAIMEKTSSANVCKNTKSLIQQVRIGEVPDRGGRTSEQAPPPPEMPPWQQRSSGPPGGGGGFRGGQRGGSSNYSRGGGGQQQSFGGGGGFNQGSFSHERGGKGGGYGSYGGDSNKSFDSAGTYNRGDSSKGDYSRGGSDYSRGGNNYSRGSSNYSQASTDYSRGSNDYSRGSNDYTRGSTDYRRSGNGSSRGNNDYSHNTSSDYSRDGSYSTSNYSRGSSDYSRESNYSQPSSTSRSYSGGFDSAGSYGGYSQDYQEPKRAKTYDQFQTNKTSYADQYVQESQHNQQYHSRDNRSRGEGRGGRSNYNRGGRGASYR